MKAKHAMTKRNTKTNETPTIVLKTIHNDIMKSNANSTLTTKQMRMKLRVAMRDVHEKNASWIFTQSQYDVVRSMFDASYAKTCERRAKRDAKTRVVKNDTKTIVENVDA